jgi:hypothetical protein
MKNNWIVRNREIKVVYRKVNTFEEAKFIVQEFENSAIILRRYIKDKYEIYNLCIARRKNILKELLR